MCWCVSGGRQGKGKKKKKKTGGATCSHPTGPVLLLQLPYSSDPCRFRTFADSVPLRTLQTPCSCCGFRPLAIRTLADSVFLPWQAPCSCCRFRALATLAESVLLQIPCSCGFCRFCTLAESAFLPGSEATQGDPTQTNDKDQAHEERTKNKNARDPDPNRHRSYLSTSRQHKATAQTRQAQ